MIGTRILFSERVEYPIDETHAFWRTCAADAQADIDARVRFDLPGARSRFERLHVRRPALRHDGGFRMQRCTHFDVNRACLASIHTVYGSASGRLRTLGGGDVKWPR